MDLREEAGLFVASSRLQSVADGLKKIIDGWQIELSETGNFDWVRDLTGQLDWNSDYYGRGEHLELFVMATRLRPIFYEALFKFRVPFGERFSEGVYETLKSYGRNVQLSREGLKQACDVYQEMATSILTELQRVHRMDQV
jgi:hypothetical protein